MNHPSMRKLIQSPLKNGTLMKKRMGGTTIVTENEDPEQDEEPEEGEEEPEEEQ